MKPPFTELFDWGEGRAAAPIVTDIPVFRPFMLAHGLDDARVSLDDYAANTTPFFAANPFYEVETKRRIDRFGNMAHVWSHYEARTSPDAADVERRGINSIQLFNHPEHGWRIIHMIWDNERPDNPLD